VYFNPPVALSFHPPEENVIDSRPVIAISPGRGRYVAWENFGSSIRIVRSEEGGLFGPPATVVSNALVTAPAIAISSDGVHVGWNEWGYSSEPPYNSGGRLMLASASRDRELEFGEPAEIAQTGIGFASQRIRSLPVPVGASPNLRLAVDPKRDNLLYAVFAGRGYAGVEVRFAQSFTRGITFETGSLRSQPSGGDQFSPNLAVDPDGHVYMSFYDTLESGSQKAHVFMARFSGRHLLEPKPEEPGEIFMSLRRLSQDTASSALKQRAPAGGSLTYHQITTVAIDESPGNLGGEIATNLGDRTGLAVSAAWTDTRERTEDIYVSIFSIEP
jgi:hypothetical protein